MNDFSAETRASNLSRMQQEEFDVLIIGGGITGAGLLLDASARGLRTALVEAHDFAFGTSSRSTKLIHGGLRYLEHFELRLVREALRERALLTRLARHLIEPVPFLIPIYSDPKRNYSDPLKMRAGLYLYDFLSGRERLGRHRRLRLRETLERAPQIDSNGLRGSLLYYDCRTDDARLVIEVLKSAHARGGLASNYTSVDGFAGSDQITGAEVQDKLTGTRFTVRARVVINATGVWLDDVLGLRRDGEQERLVRPSKGIHLIVSAERLRVTEPWLIPALNDHRFYFVVPWEARILIGTTDTDYEGDKESPRATEDEVAEILAAVNSYFPAAGLTARDVVSTIAGLRPLIRTNPAAPSTGVSREEQLFESRDGLISIAGGKLTTYRMMAKRTMDLAVKRLGLGARHSTTDSIDIGGNCSTEEMVRLESDLGQQFGSQTASHLVHAYGSESSRIASLTRSDDALRSRLIPGLPHVLAEVVYAARYEMGVGVADVLIRRLRLGILAGDESLEIATVAARCMAREVGWDHAETERQIEAYKVEYRSQLQPPRQ